MTTPSCVPDFRGFVSSIAGVKGGFHAVFRGFNRGKELTSEYLKL